MPRSPDGHGPSLQSTRLKVPPHIPLLGEARATHQRQADQSVLPGGDVQSRSSLASVGILSGPHADERVRNGSVRRHMEVAVP